MALQNKLKMSLRSHFSGKYQTLRISVSDIKIKYKDILKSQVLHQRGNVDSIALKLSADKKTNFSEISIFLCFCPQGLYQ